MSEKVLYVMGDGQRLVVKNFLHELEEREFVVRVVAPETESLGVLPGEPLHLLVCLSESMDFAVVRSVVEKAADSGWHLYLAGTINGISPEEDAFLKKVPGVHFQTFPLDIGIFMSEFELNDRARKRVLVVDDEPILLRSIQGWLRDDFEVSLVNSGETAIEFLCTHPIDLILLDYKMPTMSGADVLRQIRAVPKMKDTPVIFLTAYSDRSSVMDVMKLRPEGYILKSKSPDEIKKTVVDFFKNRIVMV
ncbi:MAG: response regulator [Treponema sp.]|nr:response regulator [Treponema sp.]